MQRAARRSVDDAPRYERFGRLARQYQHDALRAGYGVDLQLSGHTHGGQIFPFGLLVRLAVPFVAGLYERGGSRLYVSRGTGFWGPPMRLAAPAEITRIRLLAV